MDKDALKENLISVLQQIQVLSGQECPPLIGTLRPAESLPKFDSKIWPVAAGMLSSALGEAIPPEANIFFDETTKQALSIDQAVDLVCKIIEAQKQSQSAAAA